MVNKNSIKDRILEEALLLFLDKGYHGASMRMLARRVGIRGSSLYNHYPNKEAIFSALLKKAGPQLLGIQIEQILQQDREQTPSEVIFAIVNQLSENWFQEKESRLFLLLIRESPLFALNVRTHVGQMIQSAMQPLTDYIESLQRRGYFQPDFPAYFLSWQLLAPLANLRLNYLLPNSSPEDKSKGRELIDLHKSYYIKRNLIPNE